MFSCWWWQEEFVIPLAFSCSCDDLLKLFLHYSTCVIYCQVYIVNKYLMTNLTTTVPITLYVYSLLIFHNIHFFGGEGWVRTVYDNLHSNLYTLLSPSNTLELFQWVSYKGLKSSIFHMLAQWLQFPLTVQRHADYRSTGNSTAPVGVNVFVSLHACLLSTGMKEVQEFYKIFPFYVLPYFVFVISC